MSPKLYNNWKYVFLEDIELKTVDRVYDVFVDT